MIEDSRLDQAYAALADQTRRGMLVALRDGPARITDLAAPLPISFAAAARHVGVLEAAGLVEREALAQARRDLPWEEVTKDYVFDSGWAGPSPG